MALFINSLRGEDTHMHTYQHANQSNFKKPGCTGLQPVHAWFKNLMPVNIFVWVYNFDSLSTNYRLTMGVSNSRHINNYADYARS